jgi:hypothetical protein
VYKYLQDITLKQCLIHLLAKPASLLRDKQRGSLGSLLMVLNTSFYTVNNSYFGHISDTKCSHRFYY